VRSRRRREHLHRHRPVDRFDLAAILFGEARRPAADEQHRLDERHELVACGRAEESNARVANLTVAVRRDERDGRYAIDAELPCLVPVENQVCFLDRDLVGERRELVENLTGLRTRFAAASV